MGQVTALTKETLYRDSRTSYLGRQSGPCYDKCIAFCKKHAGNKILDLGCAVGDYCRELGVLGYSCTGADTNELYVAAAKARGIDAYVVGDRLPFDDKSFDTVIMFEVLEHVREPEVILREAARVARKNILITVPNCEDLGILRQVGVVYEHLLEIDHVNFFTKPELEQLISRHFTRFCVKKGDPIALQEIDLPRIFGKIFHLFLISTGIIRPRFFFRLYAVIEVH